MGIHSTPLKIAIIGCGTIVENNHLPALSSINGCRAAWFVDSDLKRAKIIAKRFAGGFSNNINDMPDDVKVALVAVPNHYHGSICVSLLNSGLDVLCEKPMAISSEECAHIVRAVKETNRMFAVSHQLKFLPAISELKRIIAEGYLGNITQVDLSLGWKFAWPSRTSFYQKQELAGGGVMMDLGCHLFDLAECLFGNIHYAELNALFNKKAGNKMDTAATIHAEFDSCVQGSIRISRLGMLENAVTVAGTKGFAKASLVDSNITLNILDSALCQNSHGVQLEVNGHDPFSDLWMRFINSAKYQQLDRDLCDPLKGMRIVQIIENLYEKKRWSEL